MTAPSPIDISVILCTRNRAAALRETLESVGRLPVPAGRTVEALLVDNGSTDESGAVIRAFAWPGVAIHRLFVAEPGIPRAANAALRNARGRVLMFLDDDVRPPRDWLSRMSEPILAGDADAVGGGVAIPDEIKPSWTRPEHEEWLASTAHWEATREPMLVGANMAIAHKVFDVIGEFDEELVWAFDTLVSRRLVEAGFRLVLRHEIVMEHRLNAARFTRTGLENQALRRAETQAFFEHHWDGRQHRFPLLRGIDAGLRLAIHRARLGARTDSNLGLPEMRMLQRVAFWPAYRRRLSEPRRFGGVRGTARQEEAVRTARAGGARPDRTTETRLMSSAKSRLDRAATLSTTLGVTRILEKLPRRPSLLVLTYHRIGDPARTPYDPGVYSSTAEAFTAHVEHLKRNFDVIRLSDATEMAAGKLRPRGCHVLITFDDGYLDNYQLAFPILRASGLSGTFFLPTAYVGTDRVPWWDAIAFAVRNARQSEVRLTYPEPKVYDIARDGVTGVIERILRAYKAPSLDDPDRFVSGVLESCGVVEPVERVFMNWAEAAEMLRGGMDIGSHTHNHYMLARLPLESQFEELRLSRSILEERLGCRVDSLAYPVGSRNAVTYQALERAGYRVAFSGFGRVNVPGRIAPYEVRRYGIEDYTRHDRFRFATAVAGVTGKYWG